MALTRTAAYAKTLCSEGLDYCEDDLTDAELYAHDPNGVGRSERTMRTRKTEL